MKDSQAMDDKGEIFIRAHETDDHAYIEIGDTGHGILENILPKKFDPLFTTRQIGTGLPSCKNIVEKHSGTISVKTEIGKGTTFIIKLPKNIENFNLKSSYTFKIFTIFTTSCYFVPIHTSTHYYDFLS